MPTDEPAAPLRVALLTSQHPVPPTDNAALLQGGFERRGWRVHQLQLPHLELRDRSLWIDDVDLARVDLLWVLGFGPRGGFLDTMQMLAQAAPPQRFVTGIEALLLWHGKYPLHLHAARIPHPQTFAAASAMPLLEQARRLGGRWVVKPPGGSFGRQVLIADADDDALARGIAHILAADPGGYCLLQRHLPEVAQGEHRVLLAGGRVIAAYGRRAADGPANLGAGGMAACSALTKAQLQIAQRTARLLQRHGIGYAGIDMAGTWVLEANIVNPGGLGTLLDLEGVNHADAVIDAVLTPRPIDPGSGP